MRECRKLLMSDPWIKAVRPAGRPVDYRDLGTRGLYLRVGASGVKTWSVRYVFEGRQRRFVIGPYPEVSLSAARTQAETRRGDAHRGTDAQGEKSRLRMGETVKDVSARWLKSEDTRQWRSRSREGFESYLGNWIIPALGSRKLVQVRRADIRAMLDGIERRPTRNRVLTVARMFFFWAVSRDLIDVSPCHGVDRLHEPKRTRTFTDEEIRQILSAFDPTPLAGYVRLLFLTGVRRDEALGMRWADVDLDRGAWTIPPALEKSGDSRSVPRRVALSDAAVKLLKDQRERTLARGIRKSPYIFPAPDGERLHRDAPKKHISVARGLTPRGKEPSAHKLAKARPRLVPADFRLHDIRRTVADRMLNELEVSAYVVDVGVLGHSKPALLGTYTPSVPQKELRAAMETWAAELHKIETGIARAVTGAVAAV